MSSIRKLVSEQDLDFAISHITSYYDTDFFPRAEEFRAISYQWPTIRKILMDGKLDDFLTESPDVVPWPKIRGGFRLVHRLEPLAAIIYTALAKKVSAGIEKSRMNSGIACSYRLRDLPNSFFADGSGYEVFKTNCENFAQNNSHALCADITDFYNKIYLHRLANAIQQMSDDPPGISSRIEYFLSELNTKASQGIPVGPAASIVFSEATLDDVDRFIQNRGFDHARYVDDIRIFGTESALRVLLQDLTIYLHSSHRLTFNSEKTFIITSQKFLESEINNHYQEERLQIFGDLEGMNPYAMHGGEDDEDEYGDEDEDEDEDEENSEDEAHHMDDEQAAEKVLIDSARKMLTYPVLDLGLIRAIVRSARSRRAYGITPVLLENIDFFAPAINDIVIFLDALTDDWFCEDYAEDFARLCTSGCMELRAVAMWFRWYFARHAQLLANREIRKFVLQGKELRHQAQAALTLATPEWVREHKPSMLRLGSSDRRSVILGAASLSKDEREKWLKPLLRGDSLSKMEQWMASWVIDGRPYARPELIPTNVFDEEIPY